MHLKNLFALLILAAAITFTACDNDDEPSFSEADLTISAGWSISAASTNLDNLAPEIAAAIPEDSLGGFLTREFVEALFLGAAAEFEIVEPCEADDIYVFLENGTLQVNDAGTDCDDDGVSDAAYEEGTTWSLSGNELTMIDTEGETTVFTVKTLNSSNLSIEASEAFEDDDLGVSINQDLVLSIDFVAN